MIAPLGRAKCKATTTARCRSASGVPRRFMSVPPVLAGGVRYDLALWHQRLRAGCARPRAPQASRRAGPALCTQCAAGGRNGAQHRLQRCELRADARRSSPNGLHRVQRAGCACGMDRAHSSPPLRFFPAQLEESWRSCSCARSQARTVPRR